MSGLTAKMMILLLSVLAYLPIGYAFVNAVLPLLYGLFAVWRIGIHGKGKD